jgi:hypothetical protein
MREVFNLKENRKQKGTRMKIGRTRYGEAKTGEIEEYKKGREKRWVKIKGKAVPVTGRERP